MIITKRKYPFVGSNDFYREPQIHRCDRKRFAALTLAVVFLLFAGLISVSAQVGPAAEIPQPSIAINPDIYYPFDEILYIEGRASPAASVQVQFSKQGAKPVRFGVKSDANGEWVLAEKVPLEPGNWEVRARVVAGADRVSDWSNPRIIYSISSGFVWGSLQIRYLPLISVISLVLLVSFGLLIYSILKVRRARLSEIEHQMREKTHALEKELREKEKQVLEDEVAQSFKGIRKSTIEELEHFEKRTQKGKPLPGEEEEHRAALLKQLREEEESLSKKIREITSDGKG